MYHEQSGGGDAKYHIVNVIKIQGQTARIYDKNGNYQQVTNKNIGAIAWSTCNALSHRAKLLWRAL